MNHKRKRPKNRRAGCLLCKPHKANHVKGVRRHRTTAGGGTMPSDIRANVSAKEQGL